MDYRWCTRLALRYSVLLLLLLLLLTPICDLRAFLVFCIIFLSYEGKQD